MEEKGELLIYGYGNPGRQDDGLGVLFTERCERVFSDQPDIRFEINYQLNIEDAHLISGFKHVVFADAALTGTSPSLAEIEAGSDKLGFFFYRIQPAVRIAFSTHAMNPESVLGLCEELYRTVPRCHVMHIAGESWEFDADPTERALGNLENAWAYFEAEWMVNS